MSKIIIMFLMLLCITLSNSFDLNEFYKKELKKLTTIVIEDLLIIITEQLNDIIITTNNTNNTNNTNTYSTSS